MSTRSIADTWDDAASFRPDPYPVYERLRDHGDVVPAGEARWLVLGFDLARSILRDDRFTTLAPQTAIRGRGGQNSLFTLEPPEHTVLRGSLTSAIGAELPGLRATLPDAAERLAASALSECRQGNPVDLIASFAQPIALEALATLLGCQLAAEQRAVIAKSSSELIRALDPDVDATPVWSTARAGARLYRLAESLIAQVRSAPTRGVISNLLSRVEDGALSPETARMTLLMLLVVAQETTVRFVGNAILSLLRSEQALRTLQGRPPDGWLEELLRLEGPVQRTRRFATTSSELLDRQLEPGDEVIVVLGAANRDPRRFAAPSQLLFDRGVGQSLGFSAGLHSCLGAQVARIEAEAAITAVLPALEQVRPVVEGLEYWPHLSIRGLARLPVVWKGKRP